MARTLFFFFFLDRSSISFCCHSLPTRLLILNHLLRFKSNITPHDSPSPQRHAHLPPCKPPWPPTVQQVTLSHAGFHITQYSETPSMPLFSFLVDCKLFEEGDCVLSVPQFLACGTGLAHGKQVTNLTRSEGTRIKCLLLKWTVACCPELNFSNVFKPANNYEPWNTWMCFENCQVVVNIYYVRGLSSGHFFLSYYEYANCEDSYSFLLSQTVSLSTSGHRLGQLKTAFSCWVFLFSWAKRWVLSLTFLSWLREEQFKVQFPSMRQPRLSGSSCENHRSVGEPLQGRRGWGEGPLREDHEAGSKEVGADERWVCVQRLVLISKRAIAFHVVLETFQVLHFLMLKFLLIFISWSSFLLNYE